MWKGPCSHALTKFLTHLLACPCGSIKSGHRREYWTITALSTLRLSLGRPAICQLRTLTASPSNACMLHSSLCGTFCWSRNLTQSATMLLRYSPCQKTQQQTLHGWQLHKTGLLTTSPKILETSLLMGTSLLTYDVGDKKTNYFFFSDDISQYPLYSDPIFSKEALHCMAALEKGYIRYDSKALSLTVKGPRYATVPADTSTSPMMLSTTLVRVSTWICQRPFSSASPPISYKTINTCQWNKKKHH